MMSRLENKADRLEELAEKTNGRVNKHDDLIDRLFKMLRGGAWSSLSRRDAQLVGVGGAGIIALWKLVEYAVHLLKGQP
jgi:hypothetical protein